MMLGHFELTQPGAITIFITGLPAGCTRGKARNKLTGLFNGMYAPVFLITSFWGLPVNCVTYQHNYVAFSTDVFYLYSKELFRSAALH